MDNVVAEQLMLPAGIVIVDETKVVEIVVLQMVKEILFLLFYTNNFDVRC